MALKEIEGSVSPECLGSRDTDALQLWIQCKSFWSGFTDPRDWPEGIFVWRSAPASVTN